MWWHLHSWGAGGAGQGGSSSGWDLGLASLCPPLTVRPPPHPSQRAPRAPPHLPEPLDDVGAEQGASQPLQQVEQRQDASIHVEAPPCWGVGDCEALPLPPPFIPSVSPEALLGLQEDPSLSRALQQERRGSPNRPCPAPGPVPEPPTSCLQGREMRSFSGVLGSTTTRE